MHLWPVPSSSFDRAPESSTALSPLSLRSGTAHPEVLVAVGLFILGTFAIGWACVAGWLGRCGETGSLAGPSSISCFLGLCGYLGSLVMITLELALA